MGRVSELRQEAEWRKCVKSEKYFLESYWHIAHPAHGRILFGLRDAQKEALERWADNRYSLTLKARQIGWTTLVAAHQFWLAFFKDDQNIIDLSRTEREAVLLLRKTKYGQKHLPDWMNERGPQSLVDHQQRMGFSNGSQITSMPSASDPARGESATLVVVDEWAFLPNPEEAWASIEPVTTGNNKFDAMFFPWSASQDRDEAWYEGKIASMLPWQLAQEYPTTPEEAFVRSGNPVFDLDVLGELGNMVKPGKQGYLHELQGALEFRC